MNENYGFDLNKVNSHNISSIGLKQSELCERRIIEFYEISSGLSKELAEYKDEMSVSEMLTLLSESLYLPKGNVHSDALKINFSRLEAFLSSVGSFDRVILSDVLVESLRYEGIRVAESDFLPQNDSPETFTYVKNPLSDEAYDVFCDNFRDPRLKYSLTLKEAAALAAEGGVTYALLPLEESGGERLHTATELIFKYDLKINSVTPVFGLDGSSDMKYALVSRKFTLPRINTDDDVYLEIRVSSSASLSDIILAAEYYGSRAYRVNTVLLDTDGEEDSYYSLVFKNASGDFAGLLAYLTLFINSYTPVGFYKNLE
nr:hypothetical protein [Oscillospiraceae bacterium]